MSYQNMWYPPYIFSVSFLKEYMRSQKMANGHQNLMQTPHQISKGASHHSMSFCPISLLSFVIARDSFLTPAKQTVLNHPFAPKPETKQDMVPAMMTMSQKRAGPSQARDPGITKKESRPIMGKVTQYPNAKITIAFFI